MMQSIGSAPHIVLGIGKYLQCDAAVGLVVVDQAQTQLSDSFENVVFKKNISAGFDIIDDLRGFENAIVVDGVATGMKPPGFCFERRMIGENEGRREQLIDSQGINFSTMLEIGRQCGYRMPAHIIYLGIETADVARLTGALTAPIKQIVNSVIEKIRRYLLLYNCPMPTRDTAKAI
jgi:hydrogenase maturation protease